MKDFVAVVWFLLPAGIANMAPIVFNRVPFLNVPVDFNRQWNRKPIFGSHKTYRGFFFGIVCSVLFVYFQKYLYPNFPQSFIIDYDQVNTMWLGFLLGFGALFGDLMKSFFKRRLNIQSGKSWVPFDQIDYIVGSLLFGALVVVPTYGQIIIALVFFSVTHPLTNLIGYKLKFKKNKF